MDHQIVLVRSVNALGENDLVEHRADRRRNQSAIRGNVANRELVGVGRAQDVHEVAYIAGNLVVVAPKERGIGRARGTAHVQAIACGRAGRYRASQPDGCVGRIDGLNLHRSNKCAIGGRPNIDDLARGEQVCVVDDEVVRAYRNDGIELPIAAARANNRIHQAGKGPRYGLFGVGDIILDGSRVAAGRIFGLRGVSATLGEVHARELPVDFLRGIADAEGSSVRVDLAERCCRNRGEGDTRGARGNRLDVGARLNAAPENGGKEEGFFKFIAQIFALRRNCVCIVSGCHSESPQVNLSCCRHSAAG